MRALGLTQKLPRLVCCQAAHANPLYQAFARARAAGRRSTEEDYAPVTARATLASAIQIGAPVSLPKAVRGLQACDGLVEQASEQELADAAAMADRTGMFNCPHTGVALACLIKLVKAGTIERRAWSWCRPGGRGVDGARAQVHRIQGPLPRGAAGLPVAHANRPVTVPAEPEQALAALHRILDALRLWEVWRREGDAWVSPRKRRVPATGALGDAILLDGGDAAVLVHRGADGWVQVHLGY
jgi:threonine synthase